MFLGQAGAVGETPVAFDPSSTTGSIYVGLKFLQPHFGPVALSHEDWQGWFQTIARAVNNMLMGRLNAVTTVTLATGTTTTILTDSRIAAGCFIGLIPQTTNAAAENWWITNLLKGSATINHSNAATTDRTFKVLIIGGMTTRAYQPVPLSMPNWLPWGQLIARSVNNILGGKINATTSVTLATGVTTTTMTDSRVSTSSFVGLMPTTSNAAAERPYVTNQNKGSCTINHANAGTTDRVFTVLIIA